MFMMARPRNGPLRLCGMQVIRLRPIRTVLFLLAVAAGSLVLPASALAGNELPTVGSISCPAAGQCMAVGSYTPSTDNPQGLILSERDGIWSDGLKQALPANANQVPDVNLSAVSCAAVGDCTVVGTYTTTTGATEGLLDSSTRYWWQPVVTPKLPAGAHAKLPVDINAVSCWATGDCLAVGDYGNSSGVQEAVSWTEQNGVWSKGAALPLPSTANATHASSLSAISCPTAATCQVSGWYLRSGKGGAIAGLVARYVKNKFARAVHVELPSGAAGDPEVELPAISCAQAGYCTAVGDYTDSNGQRQPLAVTESNGTWLDGTSPPLPVNAATSGQYATLDSVSCASSDVCAAGGSYYDSSENIDPLVLNGITGQLTAASEPVLPSTAAPSQDADMDSVSCNPLGNCLAGGYYNGVGRHLTPIALWESGNAWGGLITPTAPVDVAANSGTSLGPVTCTNAGSCTMVETFKDTKQDQSVATYAINASGNWSASTSVHSTPLTSSAATSSLTSVGAPFAPYGTRKELLASDGAPYYFESSGPSILKITWTAVETTGSGKHKTSTTVTVASYRHDWLGANIQHFPLKLTTKGRALLVAKRSVPIKVTLNLDAEGLRPITETLSFTAP
jgi:hypothetical protein